MKYLNFLFIMLLLYSCTATQAFTQKFHLSDSWYPSKKTILQSIINELSIKSAQKYNAFLDSSKIRAIIVPHAGYAYSGEVASSAYRLLNKKFIKKIIILAPDHELSFQGIALPTFDKYQTPLGILNVNILDIQKLSTNKLFHKNSNVFEREHSLEIQFPLIQTYSNNVITIVPLIVGKLTCIQAHTVAKILKPLIDSNTLVMVTTDFTHYGKHFNFEPFKNNIREKIRNLDSQLVEYIENGHCTRFEDFIQQTGATICGHYPIKIFLSLLEMNAFGDVEPRFIAYDTSGQQQNSFENSVSYIAMVFTQQKLNSVPIEQQLTQQEQRSLLKESKDVLNNLFDNQISQELLYPIRSFGVTRQHGAFATLEKNTKDGKELRGCIGRITTNEPLYKTVAIVTRDTALHDTRFTPVVKEEIPELSLKLSILSVPHPIKSYKNIILGKHGVILQSNDTSAVFLPEVPLEFKWSLKQMLEELSEKAGLSRDAWKDKKTEFRVFTTLDIQ